MQHQSHDTVGNHPNSNINNHTPDGDSPLVILLPQVGKLRHRALSHLSKVTQLVAVGKSYC